MHRSPLRLLLVEDDPVHARMVKAACQHEQRREQPFAELLLTHVTSAASAQLLLGECAFDVILLDLNLPDSEGLATFHRIQAAAPQLPIIVLTAHDSDGQATRALRSGAAGYLAKQLTGGPELRSTLQRVWQQTQTDGPLNNLQQQLLELERQVTALQQENHRLRQALADRDVCERQGELDYPHFGDVILNATLADNLS